jgi:uncharacterized protein
MQQISSSRQSLFFTEGTLLENTVVAVVLDTNVALDFLAFRDPACDPLAQLLRSGTSRWMATVTMRGEFDEVLQRPAFRRFAARRESIAAQWSRWAVLVDAPSGAIPQAPAEPGLRCEDPDDQMFVDLALHVRPSLLLSRDQALLRLAGPAKARGVHICAPARMQVRTK